MKIGLDHFGVIVFRKRSGFFLYLKKERRKKTIKDKYQAKPCCSPLVLSLSLIDTKKRLFKNCGCLYLGQLSATRATFASPGGSRHM